MADRVAPPSELGALVSRSPVALIAAVVAQHGGLPDCTATPTLTCSRRLQARSKDDNERAARWAASLQQHSSCVCAGTKSVGCRGVEVGALGRCTLLELLQRPGIDGDVEAHLRPVCRAAGAQRFRLVEEAVKFLRC